MVSEVPPDFLSSWAHQNNAGFLLLLDGLDEVAPEFKSTFLPWLRVLLQTCPFPAIITCRTNALSLRDVGSHATLELMPFNAHELHQLAKNWFEGQASEFMDWLNSARKVGWQGSPLLATIAALVFESRRKDSRPLTLAELYESFVTVVVDEAINRGVPEDMKVPADLVFVCVETFAANSRKSDIVTALATAVARRLGVSVSASVFDLARRVGDAVVKRSGFLVGTFEEPLFLHETFREYFVARAITSECSLNPVVVNEWLAMNWRSSSQRQSAIFVIGIVSNHHGVADPLLRPVAQALADFNSQLEEGYLPGDFEEHTPNELDADGALQFILDVIRSGVPLSVSEQEAVVRCICRTLLLLDFSVVHSVDPVDVLCALAELPSATIGSLLREFFELCRDGYLRFCVLYALVGARRLPEDLQLFTEIGLGNPRAVWSIGLPLDDIDGWEQFGGELYYRRQQVCLRLGRLGYHQEALAVFASIICDNGISVDLRIDAVHLIGVECASFGRSPDSGVSAFLVDLVRRQEYIPQLFSVLELLSPVFSIDAGSICRVALDFNTELDGWGMCDVASLLRQVGHPKKARQVIRRVLRVYDYDSYEGDYACRLLRKWDEEDMSGMKLPKILQ